MKAVCERCGQPLPQQRSQKSHAHFFAAMYEMWCHAPEDVVKRFPTAEHLRKYCLIKTGFHSQRSITCTSQAEARKVAAFVEGMNEFAIVEIDGTVVTVYTALSQSRKEMGAPKFQRSKRAVLDVMAQLTDTDPVTLARNVHLEDLLE